METSESYNNATDSIVYESTLIRTRNHKHS